MTKITSLLSLSGAAAVAGLLALPVYSSGAEASATSDLSNCKYNSRAKTLDCCSKIIKLEGKPQWMRGGDSGCNGAVKCYAKLTYLAAATPRCYVQIIQRDDDSSDRKTPRGRLTRK